MIASCAISPRKSHFDKQHASLTFPRRGDNARRPHIEFARSWKLDALRALPARVAERWVFQAADPRVAHARRCHARVSRLEPYSVLLPPVYLADTRAAVSFPSAPGCDTINTSCGLGRG
jgi:hypothetical protein